MTTPAHDLQRGGRYRIELLDCCAEGVLVGRFEGFADVDVGDDDGGGDYYRPLIFDIGTFTGWGQITFTEIADGG